MQFEQVTIACCQDGSLFCGSNDVVQPGRGSVADCHEFSTGKVWPNGVWLFDYINTCLV